MKIRLKDRIVLTANFFIALGGKRENGVVAIIREGSTGTIVSTNLSEEFVSEFAGLVKLKRQAAMVGEKR